ncbi:hypothetical protein D3C73_1547220 [compost metagenome]
MFFVAREVDDAGCDCPRRIGAYEQHLVQRDAEQAQTPAMQAMAVISWLRYVTAQVVDRGKAFCAQQAFERGDIRLHVQFLSAGPHR